MAQFTSSLSRRRPPPEALWAGFERAFRRFLECESKNIRTDVSEMNLCGHLAFELKKELDRPAWRGYYADTEYNRKQGGQVKTMMDESQQVINITCDLIVHSRGEIPSKDNLLAIEMKKANRPATALEADRKRLRCLTRASYDGIWSADGKTLPEHVCGYDLGLLIELNPRTGRAVIEEYRSGQLCREHRFVF